MMRAHFQVGASSHPGRRHDNADAWSATARRVVVCDGAGPLGPWSAREAVQAAMHMPTGDVVAVIDASNRAVRAVGDGTASTIVLIELAEIGSGDPDPAAAADCAVRDVAAVTVAHVGDSRCLYVSAEAGCAWLTEAHNGAAELVRGGIIDPAEAPMHPFRHRLTRSLGSPAATPEVRTLGARAGDRLVLVTDGVHATLDMRSIETHARTPGLNDAAAGLVDAAFAQGATDNMTAVVAEIVAAGFESVSEQRTEPDAR